MRRRQDHIPASVDQLFFFCAYAPHSMNTNGSGRAANALMAASVNVSQPLSLCELGSMRPHGQNRVEEHDALFCPRNEAAVVGDFATEIVVKLLENVL